jgi:transcriptional antiterminator RfaH
MPIQDVSPPTAPVIRPVDENLSLTAGERWYVVHSQVNREACAQMHLRNQDYRVFLPRIARTVRHARKTRRILAPLFPRYLFLILDIEHEQWRRINGTVGVASIVMSRDRPTAAPTGVVEALIAMSSLDCNHVFCPDIEPGQKVRVASGPFANQLGVLEKLDDNGRVRVLLEMMGAWYPIRLSREDVLPVA